MIEYLGENKLKIIWEAGDKEYKLDLHLNNGKIITKTFNAYDYSYFLIRDMSIFNITERTLRTEGVLFGYPSPVDNWDLIYFSIDSVFSYDKLLQIRYEIDGVYNSITVNSNNSTNFKTIDKNLIKSRIDFRLLSRNYSESTLQLPNKIYAYFLSNLEFDFTDDDVENLETYAQKLDITETYLNNNIRVSTIWFNKIDVTFWNNGAEEIRLDKTNYLINKTQISGVFRDNTSIQNPVITMQYFSIPNFNYCYIKEFNRYYYIDEIVNIRMNIWELTLKCDELMSFKDEILNLDCKILRQEFNYNPYMIDTQKPATGRLKTKYLYNLLNLYDSNITSFENLSTSELTMSLCTASNVSDTLTLHASPSVGFQSIYLINTFVAKKISTYIWSGTFLDDAVGGGVDWSRLVGNPVEAMLGLTLYPIKNLISLLPSAESEDVDEIIIGASSIDNSNIVSWNVKRLENMSKPIEIYGGSLPIHYPTSFIDFYNTKLTVYVPMYGFTMLDLPFINSLLENADKDKEIYIKLRYWVDFTEPVSVFEIYLEYFNSTGDITTRTIHIGECRLGVSLPITSGNKAQVAQQVATTVFKTALNLVTDVVGIDKSPFEKETKVKINRSTKDRKVTSVEKTQTSSGGDTRLKLSGAGLVKSLPNTISEFTTNIISSMQNHFNGGGSSIGFGMSGLSMMFFGWLQYPEVLEVSNYSHLVGNPSDYSGKLSELNGYTEVGACHMEGFYNATPTEITEIENALKTGVIL